MRERRPASIRFVCVVAAPEGIARMAADHPDVPIVTAAIDERLKKTEADLKELEDEGAKADLRKKVRDAGDREVAQVRKKADAELKKLKLNN